MSDKRVVSSSQQTATKTVTEPDGTITETITTTFNEKYIDGTTGTRTEVKKVKHPPGEAAGAAGAKPPHEHAPAKDPATSTAPKVGNVTDPTFVQACLQTHNTLRAQHGSPPLVINNDLAQIAQAWANHLGKIGKMQHSGCGFGENVFWSTETIDGKIPAEKWYSEISQFDWTRLESQKGTGHFTQLIWRGSHEVGIALANGPGGNFVVANYFPPGNFTGKYPENVKPVKAPKK